MNTSQKLIEALIFANKDYQLVLKNFYLKECAKDKDFKGVNFPSWVATELLINKQKLEPEQYIGIAYAVYELLTDNQFNVLTGYLKPDLSAISAMVTRSGYTENFDLNKITNLIKNLNENDIREINKQYFKLEDHNFFRNYLKSCFNNDITALLFLADSDTTFSMDVENKNILFEEIALCIDHKEAMWGKTKIVFWLTTIAIAIDQEVLDKTAHIIMSCLYNQIETYSDSNLGKNITVSLNGLKNGVQRLGTIVYGAQEFEKRKTIAELCDNYLDKSIWIKTSEPELNLPSL